MLNRLSRVFAIPPGYSGGPLMVLFALVTVFSILAALILETWLLALAPLVFLLLWVTASDLQAVFFLLLIALPISVEQQLPGGFGTDLPSEPLMWLLLLTGTFWLLQHWREANIAFLRHPITLALIAHLGWITVTTITSQDLFISIKFLLAKIWFIVVFYFVAGRIFTNIQNYKRFLWCFFLPLFATLVWVIARQSANGFSFEEVNYAMGPFYRNHVIYASLLAAFIPFVWYGRYWYPKGKTIRIFLIFCVFLMVFGINFSYTRAAYVALLAAVGFGIVVKYKLTRFTLLLAVVGIIAGLGYVASRDNWLDLAPNYEKTVTHTRFDNLIEATAKLEDISTMERVYRWVAAAYMIQEKPVAGFGPGTFYTFYKGYTVNSFKTYVSDNPERSGIHNYYLMTTVEQGILGLIMYLLFVCIVIIRGEQAYHLIRTPWRRHMVLAALMCFVIICVLMLMNDLVETDKIGSLFFMSAAIITAMDLHARKSVSKF